MITLFGYPITLPPPLDRLDPTVGDIYPHRAGLDRDLHPGLPGADLCLEGDRPPAARRGRRQPAGDPAQADHDPDRGLRGRQHFGDAAPAVRLDRFPGKIAPDHLDPGGAVPAVALDQRM